MKRIVKEYIWAIISSLPWKKLATRFIVKGSTKHTVKMINTFPLKSSISDKYGACSIVLGLKLNFKNYFQLVLGEHVKVHKEENPCNSMDE